VRWFLPPLLAECGHLPHFLGFEFVGLGNELMRDLRYGACCALENFNVGATKLDLACMDVMLETTDTPRFGEQV